MAYNVPLSSLSASDGNITYTQTSVLRVGQGGNVTVAQGLFESNGQVGIGTTVYNTAGKLQVEGNIFVANGSSWFGNVSITNTTATTSTTSGALTVAGGIGISNGAVIAGNVGVGTTSTAGFTNNALAVFGSSLHKGNIFISNTSTISGLIFSDGTFQNTAGGGGGTTINLSNDTSTNAPRYINFTSSTTGTVSTLYTSSPGLIYYPVTSNLVVGGNLTVSNAVGISTFAGNVGIGTTTGVSGYILSVNGGLAATTKSFVIKHPTNPDMKLQYASLEGPEHGVYVRGRLTGTDKIQLPDYWSTLVNMDTTTVNLTPIGEFQKLYVTAVDENSITVGCDSWFKQNIDCYYTVYAERRDVDKLKVEI